MLKNKPRLLFYFLLILFALPAFAAWYAFQHPERWTQHTTNHGVLLKPMKTLSEWPLQVASKKWLMLYVN